MTGHTFSCAHGKDQHLNVIDFVISESGLYALHMEMSVWMQESVRYRKNGFYVRASGEDGEAERFFFHSIEARRVSQTRISF